MPSDAEQARMLDQNDPLSRFRDEFVISDADLIYLDGNSLGRLPRRTVERMQEAVGRQWGDRLIRSWNDGWFTASARIGDKLAPLIGAAPGEVIIADSTSINLFKLAVAALRVHPQRHKLVSDDTNFPSDLYVLDGAAKLCGPNCHLEIVRSLDGITVPAELLEHATDSTTALVALTQTAFKSGFTYDIADITRLAQRHGAWSLWDLSHSVGVLPIDLASARVEMAVGCTYKYLCGGPGAPAFLYIRRDLHEKLLNPIQGWFGRHHQFDFAMDYRPANGIARFQTGTPPLLSLLAVEAGIDLVLEAGIDQIRAKSVRQTEYLVELWKRHLRALGVELKSPEDSARRGSHVSLGHPAGSRIAQALIDLDVIPDFRRPDNIRFGLAPLYTTYREIHDAVLRLRHVIEDRSYERYSDHSVAVT